jgi:hypothetical protein
MGEWGQAAVRAVLRLLQVLDPEKPDSPVVQVRRGMMEGAV